MATTKTTDDTSEQPATAADTADQQRHSGYVPARPLDMTRLAAQEGGVAAASRNEPDPRIAAMEAELERSRAEARTQREMIAALNAARIQDQAVAFAESELLAGRATPAEAEPLVALYAQAAHDDAERPAAALGEGKSRVSHLKATQALRAPHGLTQEQLDATQDGAAAAAAFDPSKLRALATPAIVAPVTTRDEKPKTTADVPKERAKDLLGKSRLGLAALKAPAEK